MSARMLAGVFVAALIAIGASGPAWASTQLGTFIDPNAESSHFNIRYQDTISYDYDAGSQLHQLLDGKQWLVEGVASEGQDIQIITDILNQKLASDGSFAQVSDLEVDYRFQLNPAAHGSSMDFTVVVQGSLIDYVVTTSARQDLVDLGWRGLTVTDDVYIDGIPINIPASLLRVMEPAVYDLLIGTEAAEILLEPIMNAESILGQPMDTWHFLFDPTGIGTDAGTFGLSPEIAGAVVSAWTMGESSIREGIKVETVNEVTVVLDQPYVIKSTQGADNASIRIIGYGNLDTLDGLDIAGVSPEPPEGYSSNDDFPVFIIYGMAGMAAAAGIGFFIISNRAIKNEKIGQQGIDPSNLVGYQTSASSGGYQTNRGEAQLRNDSDYQKTRNVYDQYEQKPLESASTPSIDAACGCATSAEMGTECDCDMQGSCLCDSTCGCSADVCHQHTNQM